MTLNVPCHYLAHDLLVDATHEVRDFLGCLAILDNVVRVSEYDNSR